MNYSRSELMKYISEEIRTIPCFYCIDGMLELADVTVSESAHVDVLCPICKSKDKFELKL